MSFLDTESTTGVGGGNCIVLGDWEPIGRQACYEQRDEPIHMGGRSQSLLELTKHLAQFLGLRGKELMHAPVALSLVAIPAGGDEVGNAVRSATALGADNCAV